jgi:hypothetical protein
VTIVERLAALGRELAARRASLRVLMMVAALAIGLALLAAGARFGLLAWLRWLPLLWWGALVAGVVLLVRAARRDLAPGHAALRATAGLVETEQALRRGALVGLVDAASAPGAATSPALVARAGRLLEARLPVSSREWAPAFAGMLGARLRRWGAAGAILVLAAAGSLWQSGEAAATLVSPLRALRAVVAPRIAITASAAAVRPGESVRLTITTTAPGRAMLHLRHTGEPWTTLPLDLGEGAASHTVAGLTAPLFAWASLEGTATDTLRVAVLEPLLVARLSLSARYPAYLDRAGEDLDPGLPLTLPVGTVLTVRGVASAPLTAGALMAGDTVRLSLRGTAFEGSLVVRGSARWELGLADREGAPLADPPVFDVRAVPDSAPVVTVPVPGADTTAPLDLRPALVVDARDDHGLARVEIVSWRVSRLGIVSDTLVEPLPDVAGADRLVVSQVLDLGSRGLLPGDTLRYFVRAWDRAPVAHMGRSREYAMRLRSLAELREAVRAGTDSLAREAAAAAAAQTQLTRQTEDLAAQRNRSQDRVTRPQPDQRGARERPEQGTLDFEQASQAQRIAEQQQALAERVEQLRAELERLQEAARDAGLTDPEWQEQLRNLEQLMREAVTPQLRERLEELRRALERLDPRAVQDALRRLTEEQRRMREELRRSAELFERAALEGSLQTAARNAEALRRDQEEWNRRAEQRRDSAAAAAEQAQLRAAADSLARQLERLGERLGERGDTASARVMEEMSERVEQAGEQMRMAQQAMQGGERQEAGRRGRQASQQLQSVPETIEETRREMSAAWRAEVMRLLDQSLSETVTLAAEQQRLARELRRGDGTADARSRQSAAEQGVSQLVRQLQEAAGRNALVSPRLGAALGRAREQVSQSRQALEGPSPSSEEAAERAQDAARQLAAAAFQLMQSRDEVGGAQSGSGFQEAVERMAQMAGQQGQLNDELGGLLPMLGGGTEELMQQLRLLAERQRSLANQMERLGEAGIPGRPDQLAEEARQLADRIESARLDRATLERQQRLFRRMLDAGRSLRNEEEPDDPERRSRTAEQGASRAVRGGVPSEPAQRFPVPGWESLRHLSPSERAMVIDYFRRLNAQPR